MTPIGRLVRYADDAVVVCRNSADAKRAYEGIIEPLSRLGLKPQMEKTRIVHLRIEGVDVLGCPLRMAMSRRYKGRGYLYRWPNQKAMKKVRERIREITSCKRNGNAARKFNVIDRYVWRRLTIFSNRVRGRNHPTRRNEFDYRWYAKLGVVRLMGNIQYPVVKARAA